MSGYTHTEREREREREMGAGILYLYCRATVLSCTFVLLHCDPEQNGEERVTVAVIAGVIVSLPFTSNTTFSSARFVALIPVTVLS